MQFIASLETAVPVTRSVDQIRQLVERFGAAEFGIQYDPVNGRPVAVSFKIRDRHLSGDMPGSETVFLPVALRAPSDGVMALLLNKRPYPTRDQRDRMKEQAERVAWRHLHDFVRASLIGVQTGIMSLGEAFMANLVITLPTGEAKRLGELTAEGQILRPTGGRLLLGKGHP